MAPSLTRPSSKVMQRVCAWPSSSLRSSTCNRCHFNSKAISSTGTHSKPLLLGSWLHHPPTTHPSCLLAQPWGPQQAGNHMGSSSLNTSRVKLQHSLVGVAGAAGVAGTEQRRSTVQSLQVQNNSCYSYSYLMSQMSFGGVSIVRMSVSV